VGAARALHVTTIHLVTDSATGWYAAQGWDELGPASVHGHPMTAMRLPL